MSSTLVRKWQDEALMAKCNFCAIEIGEAASSDAGLPELLRAHVPEGAQSYIVQRDANVSENEIGQLKEVLKRLAIQVSSETPLNASDQSTWVAPLLDEITLQAHTESPDPALLLQEEGGRATAEDARRLRAEQSRIQDELNATKKMLEQNQASFFQLHQELASLLAMQPLGASLRIAEEAPSPRESIRDAFNQLQFSDHWQKAQKAGTSGASVVTQAIEQFYGDIDGEMQSHAAVPLQSLLLAMRGDPDVLSCVLNTAAQLPASATWPIAVSKMCIAFMEHEVASGARDDDLSGALYLARCVQRYTLLEGIDARRRDAKQDRRPAPSFSEAELRLAFEMASISLLRHGGRQGLPLQGLTPETAQIVQADWQDVMENGNGQGFQQFLAQWTPWQALLSRRAARLAAEREAQQAMN